MSRLRLGIDVGSTTVKLALVDSSREILARRYLRAGGQPRQTLLQALDALAEEFDLTQLEAVGSTGSGGGPVAALIGAGHVNEIVAQAHAVGVFHPEARTVIEIGGQDSKFLSLAWDEASGRMAILDFAMNTLCAAGTGSFLDQQAERLGIAIDAEFARIALTSKSPARVAGRCTVFAKSDMIHLQQEGTPLPDILAGLCLALARNFRSVIGKGKAFTPPVLFQGGVAANAAAVRAFETALGLQPGEIIVPEHHRHMAALGTAFIMMDRTQEGRLPPFRGFEALRDAIRTGVADSRSMPPLRAGAGAPLQALHVPAASEPSIPVYLGVDVGSISTNVVLIDELGRVVARRYLPTAGRPLEAVRRGLLEIGLEAAERVEVRGVGTTGSGRHLSGDFVGADVVRNEITAQARAALALDPAVDTIFELGGQDSKYIRLDHGTVVDFAMNNACAAGTGAFLEEQADRLRLDIHEDFARMAFASVAPACLGERCTVFMESDLIHHQQRGARVEDLTAGLAYSIVENYLNRVVSGRPVGERVFFQGGVASNRSVAAAFEAQTGRPITIPPHHDVTGAIGAALLAREALASRNGDGATRFKGFDLSERRYESNVFVCRACPNLCEVNRVTITAEPPVFYGARCDKFEEVGRERTALGAGLPDLFAERNALLLGDWVAPGPRNGRMRIAVPRVLVFYDLFPYWRAFFRALDIELVLSAPTTPRTIRETQERAVAETCFPVKLVYGHVAELLDADADFLLLPAVLDRENIAKGQTRNHYCPFIPAASYLVKANMGLDQRGPRPLVFPLRLLSERGRRNGLRALAAPLGVSLRSIARAAEAAEAAQREFYAALRRRGRELLASLPQGRPAAVIVGRPYNTSDLGACQDLPYKLRKLGVLPIPTDFLPLESAQIPERYAEMYWRCGQDILAAGAIVAKDPRLSAIYLTNFNCGPDSFLVGFFRRIMAGKPFLELEVDDHTADAGILTRCEAFFESLAARPNP
jgi:predicted CoA-substrate-specific enzyme activase